MSLLADGNFWNESLQRGLVTLIAAAVSGALSFAVGRWWGRRKAVRDWKTKEFLGRINVSLNTFSDGKLKIRTILERSLEEVFDNTVAVEKVFNAAKRVTEADPILPVAAEDRFFLLNYVLNAVAEQFVWGIIRQDAGLPVRPVRYGICLTCEAVGETRERKVRALMIREDHLKVFPYAETMPGLESEHHVTRVETLRKVVELYQKEPDQFIMLEVCV